MVAGRRSAWWIVGVLVVAAGCVPVTVNVYFPQEKLDSAASQIVDMSRGAPPPEPAPAPPPPKGPGSSLRHWLATLAPRAAWAEPGDVRIAQAPRTDTEEIRRLTASQQSRLGALQQWMSRGCVGESNQGLVEARPGQGCAAEVGRLIADENRDREALVDVFMRQNRIPPGDRSRVRASFAKAYRDRAPGGAWVQQDGGQWGRR